MRWYLSGPMTGLPALNAPAFQAAATIIRATGHDVLNPVELCPPGVSWDRAMAIDLAALEQADGVITLPGWERSRGAQIEVRQAHQQDLPIWALDDWLRTRPFSKDDGEREY